METIDMIMLKVNLPHILTDLGKIIALRIFARNRLKIKWSDMIVHIRIFPALRELVQEHHWIRIPVILNR